MIAVDLIFSDDLEMDTDFKIRLSDDQHVEHILKANPGQFYQYPDVGYGIINRLNGTIDVQTETKLIKQALENDNFNVNMDGIKINTTTGEFNINKYNRVS